MEQVHHRKIELQSLEDLRYLIANVNDAAQERIDGHLSSSSKEDPSGEKRLGKDEGDVEEGLESKRQRRRRKREEMEGLVKKVLSLFLLLYTSSGMFD